MTDAPSLDTHLELSVLLGQVFRPAAPIDQRDLFAGRVPQLNEVFGVTGQTGQHGVIYGERGVGKTSLAAVAAEMLSGLGRTSGVGLTTRANCDTNDDFTSIWRKVLREFKVLVQTPTFGFTALTQETVANASRYVGDEVTPDDVRQVLQMLSSVAPVTVFIDEFDRLPKDGAQRLFSDTIKTLSDQLVRATIVLVGVADNVSDLVAEHESIERALVQIHMPRMSMAELAEIVTRGLRAAGMAIADDALERITQLSQGLPHYTHQLAQLSARATIDDDLRLEITMDDVDRAVSRAIGRAQQSIMDAYHRATLSTRTTLYPQVLLACALAPGDDFGFFSAPDVREPLTRIMGRPYDIPAFAQHLNELSASARGPVLQKKGSTRRFRYRFVNPLLQPHIIMRGLAEGLIDAADLQALTDPRST